MSLIEKPASDLAQARGQLINEIDRLGDVVQDLESRLDRVIIPASSTNKSVDGCQEAPVRSILADEIYNRAARVGSIADRLISLRNSLDL
jgi:hypothetical protein